MKLSYVLSQVLFAIILVSCSKERPLAPHAMDEGDFAGDLLISEILVDPKKDGAEFLELYNSSDKVIDLAAYTIASTNSKGVTGTPRTISASSQYIYPGTYKLISKSPDAVLAHYPSNAQIETVAVENFPQLTNTEGAVLLLKGKETIDSLHYSAKMHDPLIRNSKGVSFERVSFKKATNNAGNFISSSATTGYASPGYQNSQRDNSHATGPLVQLSKRTLDNSKNETISVQFNLREGGKMTNITIFSSAGRKIFELVQNHRLGTLDHIYWDGQATDQRKLPSGTYYFHIEIYDSNGSYQQFKEICFISS